MRIRPRTVCKESGRALRMRVRLGTVRRGRARLGTVCKGSGRTLRVRVRPGTVYKRGVRPMTVRKRGVTAGTVYKGSKTSLRVSLWVSQTSLWTSFILLATKRSLL